MSGKYCTRAESCKDIPIPIFGTCFRIGTQGTFSKSVCNNWYRSQRNDQNNNKFRGFPSAANVNRSRSCLPVMRYARELKTTSGSQEVYRASLTLAVTISQLPSLRHNKELGQWELFQRSVFNHTRLFTVNTSSYLIRRTRSGSPSPDRNPFTPNSRL